MIEPQADVQRQPARGPLILGVRGRALVVALDVVAVADAVGRYAAVGEHVEPGRAVRLVLRADVAALDLGAELRARDVPNASAYRVSDTCTWLRLRSA